MRRIRLPVWVLCGVTLTACQADSIHQPEGAPSLAVGAGVSASATGSGGFVAANGELRKFTFTAQTFRDGGVGGQFQLVAGNADLVMHGTVTCMTVIDNQAWIGGPVDRNSLGLVLTHAFWRAVDNSATSEPDQVSVAFIANNPAGNLLQAYCADTPAAPPLNTVTHGSISIR